MDNHQIEQAVAVLRRGGLVAFPTETVYGLGADAANPAAIRKLYAAKGRPADHPVIVHIASMAQLNAWAREITPLAQTLAGRFWPGPLTMILKRAPGVSDAVTGGQDTVGLRIPAHPVAHLLLEKFGGGIAAPSANRFGRVSATLAEHVRREFGDRVDFVFDGGECDVGIESTIVDATGSVPVLLRPGHITARDIEQATGLAVAAPDQRSPRAPGTLAAHYAPVTPLLVMEGDLLLELAATLTRQGQRVAVLARGALQPLLTGLTWIAAPGDVHAYAHDLYASLRTLDGAGCDALLVEQLPQSPEWAAINDRLLRAAAGSRPPSTA
jgi:L-threonylcarbamoyladenylate synthase